MSNHTHTPFFLSPPPFAVTAGLSHPFGSFSLHLHPPFPCPTEDDDDEETDVLRLPGACVRVIPYADLDFGAPRKIIGGGFHAVVYRARYCGEDVAVKVFKAGSTGGVDRDRFCREVAMLVRARHPSVVLCYGVCVDPLGIVTQFVPHDDRGSVANLRTWLHSAAPGLRAITATAARLAHTLQFLHRQSPPVLHRDLRSVNVLIDTTGRPILADFTLSCLADAAGATPAASPAAAAAAAATATTTSTTTKPPLPPAQGPTDEFYEVSAPEVLAGAPYTVRSEIWSFGLMLWELFVRQPPQTWHHEPLLAQLRACCPSPAMLALISRCLDADPAARPSLDDIIATLAAVLAALDTPTPSSPSSSTSTGTAVTATTTVVTAVAPSSSPPLLRPRCAQDAVAADTARQPRKYARLCDIARALAATTALPDPAPSTHGP